MQDGPVTLYLSRIRQGDPEALDQLMPILYDELRTLARRHLKGERSDHTLGATALVHEAYFKIAGAEGLNPADRGQFFSLVSHSMRQVLVDHARRKKRLKRGGSVEIRSLEVIGEVMSDSEAEEILVLHDALSRLAERSERAARVVELRFFAGLKLDEVADALQVSARTAHRDWSAARAWLRKEVAADLSITLDP